VRRLLTLLCLTIVASTVAPRAQTPEIAYPALRQPVTDTANVIDADSAATLDQRLRALRAATNDVMAIVTVPTIEPAASVEEYAVKLFERAGIGSRELDNGILILVAVKEKGIRIEVGYGLEGIVTDGFAGDTIRQEIVPEFKNGRYGAGLVAGATRLIQQISEGRKTDIAGIPAREAATPAWAVLLIGLGGAVFVIALFVIVGRGQRRQARASSTASASPAAWVAAPPSADDDHRRRADDASASASSSDSSSSDSGGFDGGSSGGGGASGSW
jgi:uncharacterized protein